VPTDRGTIQAVLTAYVRDHAPWPPRPALPSLQVITHRLITFAGRQRSALQRRRAKDTAGHTPQGRADDQGTVRPEAAADVQAALTVLGRRQLLPGGRMQALSLPGVDLRGAVFGDANLEWAMLSGSNLQYAWLFGANLQDAWLNRADLRRADLRHANLQGALLDEAKLEEAVTDRGTRWPYGWDRARAEAEGVRYRD
jgi:hypothetical protein